MPQNEPSWPTDAEAMTRLLALIGYPQDEIVATIANQFKMTDEDSRNLYARVTERTLSAEEQAATL